ncbi:hypothetical protein AALP_AA6G132500 [Arabis alpina]|uniref:TIR domain-containing protein n=1 Tax=Arabis alpina TaxID=50452 RepID=A0A087GNZ0_ARAAL|nr:hypothetical protein AALP_AA6G132500 [Arabis alpina]
MTDSEKAEPIVYISCIDEVRYSFVSHLSDALCRKGIDVFVDSDDQLSEEAKAVVERARVSLIVLPRNLEPTTACLGKLVRVLDCKRRIDQMVVPVLYGIGTFAGNWRRALQEISGLSQSHYSRKERTDSELVEEIARVCEKLLSMERIGISSKLMEIENMVCKSPLIRSVGIWGMPGIGKTVLAKAAFDQFSGQFDAYCFIKDYDQAIREKSLNRLLEEKFLIEKPGAGRSTIPKQSLLRKKLNNKRVLVVLDDVRNPLLAESFLGGTNWFGPKSLIIITTRDKQVLRLCRVNQIYEVQGLNEEEALQLFSLRASIHDMPEQDRSEMSRKVIEYANGNPLALDIYGRELKGKIKPLEVETAFIKIKQLLVDAFKSSYGTLSDNEKNIFLDIACFFHGEPVHYVMQLLKGCGFFPHIGIDVLVEKCMVTVSENHVWMHNLIQDVGREIVNGETVKTERRSRLWEPSSIEYLLVDNEEKETGEPETTINHAQGTEEIQGMFLDTSNLSFDVKPTAFQNMLNLRLLKVYCSALGAHPVINLPKGIDSLPNELRLLHWEHYPLQSLPPTFDPVHLVEINMPYSQLQTLWDGTKKLETLRTIRLCHSKELVDIGDLSKAENLEVVDLQGCTKLQNSPDTGKLQKLRVVNLSGTEIKTFPEVSPNVEALYLQETHIKEISVVKRNGRDHVDISELEGLSDVLILEHVASLKKSSSSSQNLGKLICLDLKDCSHLQSLPDMVDFESLKVLDLSGCSRLKTIERFPRNLKELYLAVTAVRELPQLPQTLKLLNAHGCVSLEWILHLDPDRIPMHYTFSNCFHLSRQVVNVFLVKALANVKCMAKDCHQELNKAFAFSFSAPSHAETYAKFDLQQGSSVMTQLNTSWKSMLLGFAMLVEVAFPEEDYSFATATGFSINCVCRWKNKEGRSYRIESNLLCWGPGKAVKKDHMFAFCDVNMRPSTDEGSDPDIWADLVVFEFFLVDNEKKLLDDSYKVKRCGVSAIDAKTGNKSLESISPVLSLAPMEVYGNKVEVLRGRYDGLHEIEKDLFLYIACLFNDEDLGLVAPLIANTDLEVSSGLKVLANKSLIGVSSNGEIVMHCLLRKMGKEIFHAKSMPTRSLTRDFYQKEMDNEIIHSENLVPTNDKSDQDSICSIVPEVKKVLPNISRGINGENDDDFSAGSKFTITTYAPNEGAVAVLAPSYEFKLWEWDLRRPNGNVFIINARDLSIEWSENPDHWTWLPLHNEYTKETDEAAFLRKASWLDVAGRFDTRYLTPMTRYEVVFIVKLDYTTLAWEPLVKLDIAMLAWETPVKLYLVLHGNRKKRLERTVDMVDYMSNQWVEILVGEFTTSRKNIGEISFAMYEHQCQRWKSGLFVKGVVIRPKY